MGDFNRSRSGSRGGFGGGNRGGFNRDSAREMFDAVCDNCGRDCQVPFRPSGNKPVLCNDCFRGKEDRDERQPMQRRNDFRENNSRSFNNDRRPEFSRSNDFSNRGDSAPQVNNSKEIAELKRQIEQLHVKLDKVLRAVESSKPHSVQENVSSDVVSDDVVAAVPAKVRKPRKAKTEKTKKK